MLGSPASFVFNWTYVFLGGRDVDDTHCRMRYGGNSGKKRCGRYRGQKTCFSPEMMQIWTRFGVFSFLHTMTVCSTDCHCQHNKGYILCTHIVLTMISFFLSVCVVFLYHKYGADDDSTGGRTTNTLQCPFRFIIFCRCPFPTATSKYVCHRSHVCIKFAFRVWNVKYI